MSEKDPDTSWPNSPTKSIGDAVESMPQPQSTVDKPSTSDTPQSDRHTSKTSVKSDPTPKTLPEPTKKDQVILDLPAVPLESQTDIQAAMQIRDEQLKEISNQHMRTRHFMKSGLTRNQFLGEFLCTYIYYFALMAVSEDCRRRKYMDHPPINENVPDWSNVSGLIVSAFAAIGVTESFEQLSGAFMYPMLAVGIWACGGITIVQLIQCLIAELSAGIFAMWTIEMLFPGQWAVIRRVVVLPQQKDVASHVWGSFVWAILTVIIIMTIDHGMAQWTESNADQDAKIKRLGSRTGPMVMGCSAVIATIYNLNLNGMILEISPIIVAHLPMKNSYSTWLGYITGGLAGGLIYALAIGDGFPRVPAKKKKKKRATEPTIASYEKEEGIEVVRDEAGNIAIDINVEYEEGDDYKTALHDLG